jgi:tRNA threonylcarbamoyladenosine biosynthesis protein TsaE
LADIRTITRSPEETAQYGRDLAARLHPPMLVLLSGDLGAGKTTLAKGLIGGLGAAREDEVTSPTFTLVHLFRRTADNLKVYHVDLYRVLGFADLESLGLEDVLAESAIMIVEWPDRLTLRTDWPVVRVHLEHMHANNADENGREITVSDPCDALGDARAGFATGAMAGLAESRGDDGG